MTHKWKTVVSFYDLTAFRCFYLLPPIDERGISSTNVLLS